MKKRKRESRIESPIVSSDIRITLGDNKPPEVIVEFDKEDAQFILAMVEDNMALLLQVISRASDREKAEKMIDLLEKNKRVRQALHKAGVKTD